MQFYRYVKLSNYIFIEYYNGLEIKQASFFMN